MELTYTDGNLTVTITGTIEDAITILGRSLGFTTQWQPTTEPTTQPTPDRNGNTGPCCDCGSNKHHGAAWYENYKGQLFCWPCADGAAHPTTPITDGDRTGTATGWTAWAAPIDITDVHIHAVDCTCPLGAYHRVAWSRTGETLTAFFQGVGARTGVKAVTISHCC